MAYKVWILTVKCMTSMSSTEASLAHGSPFFLTHGLGSVDIVYDHNPSPLTIRVDVTGVLQDLMKDVWSKEYTRETAVEKLIDGTLRFKTEHSEFFTNETWFTLSVQMHDVVSGIKVVD